MFLLLERMCYNMLARKVGYVHFHDSAAFPVENSGTYTGSRARSKHRSSHRTLIGLLVGTVAVIGFSHVALSAAITNYGYSLMQEKQAVQQLHRDNELLKLDIAKMQTPERIYSIATKQLGMVSPTMVLYGPSYAKHTNGTNTR